MEPAETKGKGKGKAVVKVRRPLLRENSRLKPRSS